MATVEQSEQLKKNKDRQHPLDRAGVVSYMNFFWLGPILEETRAGRFDQSSHSDLPVKDASAVSFGRLLGARARSSGIFGAVVRVFICQFLGTALLTILDVALSGALTLVLFFLSKQVEAQIKQHGRVVEWQESAKLVSAMVGCTLVKSYLSEIATLERMRISLRIQGGVKSMVFDKLLRIGLVNPNDHDEGSIINHLQVDIGKFETCMWAFSGLVYNICNFSVTVVIGVWLFSNLFYVFIGFLLASSLPASIIFYVWFKVKARWLSKKDARMSYWKNLYGVARYFKTRAAEVHAFKKMNRRRTNELAFQFYNSLSLAIFILVMLMWPPASILSFLYLYFKAGYELEVSKIAIFIKMIVELFV